MSVSNRLTEPKKAGTFKFVPPSPKPLQLWRDEDGFYFVLREFLADVGATQRGVSEWIARFRTKYPTDATTCKRRDDGTWLVNIERIEKLLASQPRSGSAPKIALERLLAAWRESPRRANWLAELRKRDETPLFGACKGTEPAPAPTPTVAPIRAKLVDRPSVVVPNQNNVSITIDSKENYQ